MHIFFFNIFNKQTSTNTHLCVCDVRMKPKGVKKCIKTAGEKEAEGEVEAGRSFLSGPKHQQRDEVRGEKDEGRRERKGAQDFRQSMKQLIFYFLFELFQWGSGRRK